MLPQLGETYIQARNRGGGLGKHVREISPILIENFDHAFDPDAGVGFSLTELIAIHAGSMAMGEQTVPVIDMEFAAFPGGLSFFEIPGMSLKGATAGLISQFGGVQLDPGELESWRREIQPDPEMCKTCQRSSEVRVKEMEQHPLFHIIDHAAANKIPLECRLTAEHIDFTANMIPHEIFRASGVLIATAEKCSSALHIDFRYVHTFTIHRANIDDRAYSILEIYDTTGEKNLTLMSDAPDIERVWLSICDEAREPGA